MAGKSGLFELVCTGVYTLASAYIHHSLRELIYFMLKYTLCAFVSVKTDSVETLWLNMTGSFDD